MGARYSRQTGYTLTRRHTPARPAIRTVQRRIKFGPTTAKFIGLAILAILVGFALTNNGSSATNAYVQTGVRQQVSQVEQDIEALKLEAKRVQSIQSLQTSPAPDLQPIGNDTQFVAGDVAGASTEAPH